MNIDQWVARPKLFALEDGVGELMLGLNAAVTGSAFAVSFTLPKGSPQAQYSTFVVQAIWLCASLGMAWGLKTIRARVTIPRGGYVGFEEPRPIIGSRITTRALIAGLAFTASLALVFLTISRGPTALPWDSLLTIMSCGFALLIASFYLAGAVRFRLTYMYYLAGFSLLLGIWMYWTRPGTAGVAMLMALEGAASALAGGIKLRRFMKSHPAPDHRDA
jgi:hypothetical protein